MNEVTLTLDIKNIVRIECLNKDIQIEMKNNNKNILKNVIIKKFDTLFVRARK